MEGRRNHRVPAFALALILSVLPPTLALADESSSSYNEQLTTTTVYTDDSGAVIDSQFQGHSGAGTGTQASGSGSGPHCFLREVKDMDEDLTLEYWARRMRHAPYYVICGSENRGIVWIEISLDEPGGGAAPAANPRDIALRIRERMPIPQATVHVNPNEGLVGADSWFWLQGYSGSPVTDSTNAFGRLVEVEATVTRYEWSFGDGVTLTSETPGRAYPERSEIRHVYERSSAGLPEGYGIDVSFEFAVRYRVDGGAWIEIPGITRTTHADYPVRESQAVIER